MIIVIVMLILQKQLAEVVQVKVSIRWPLSTIILAVLFWHKYNNTPLLTAQRA